MSFVDDLIARLNDVDKRLRHIEKLDVNPTPTGYPVYSGTPTAGAIAYWTGAGTVTYGPAVTYSNGNLTIAGTATSGAALAITRNLTAASTDSPVVSILQDHASDDQPALQVTQDSGAVAVKVIGDATSSDIALKVAGVTVEGYLGQYTSGVTQLAINRRVGAGAFSDTGKAAAAINLSSASGDGNIAMLTSPTNNTTPVLALTIDKNGKVSIGTTAATDTLFNLLGDASNIYVGLIYLRDSTPFAVDVGGRFGFGGNYTASLNTVFASIAGLKETATSGQYGGYLQFMTRLDGGAMIERARITSLGLVLIGVTTGNASVLGIKAGTSTNDAAVGGVLYVDSGSHANGTTVETDLASYSVPANTLSANNMSVVFKAWGTITANANTKTLKVKFGASSYTIVASTLGSAASTWVLNGTIIRTGAATQDVLIEVIDTAGLLTKVTISTAAETLSGASALKLTGQSSAASSDVIQEGFKVWWEDANT